MPRRDVLAMRQPQAREAARRARQQGDEATATAMEQRARGYAALELSPMTE